MGKYSDLLDDSLEKEYFPMSRYHRFVCLMLVCSSHNVGVFVGAETQVKGLIVMSPLLRQSPTDL